MKTDEIINYIKGMNEKDKLKLAIRINETAYTNIDYDKNKLFEEFDTRLKEIDTEYKNNLNIPNYLLMVVAWISELSKEEQNKIGLYLFNTIKMA